MSSTQAISIRTSLQELNIPYLDILLDEVFVVATPRRFPDTTQALTTVGDLIDASAMNADDVLRRLRQLRAWSRDIFLDTRTLAALQQDQPGTLCVLDIRLRGERAGGPLPGSIALEPGEFMHELAHLRSKTLVLVDNNEERSYSAALYLKEQGFTQVYALAGGVKALLDP